MFNNSRDMAQLIIRWYHLLVYSTGLPILPISMNISYRASGRFADLRRRADEVARNVMEPWPL